MTNSGDGTISAYEGPGLQATGRITLGGMPHGLRPSADGSVIVVANTMAGELDLVEPNTDRVVGVVPVGASPAQVAVTADGRLAFVGITDPPSVVKVDLSSRARSALPHSGRGQRIVGRSRHARHAWAHGVGD